MVNWQEPEPTMQQQLLARARANQQQLLARARANHETELRECHAKCQKLIKMMNWKELELIIRLRSLNCYQ